MAQRETERQIRQLAHKSNLLAALCLPVILWQAWRLNQKVLRVAEADGLSGHIDGSKPALKLLLIGESTAAGVGVRHNDDGLAGHLARALAEQSGQAIHWQVIARNGMTAAETRKQSCPRVAGGSADLVIIVHGFNDTVGWTSARQWRSNISDIINHLETRLHRPQFVLTGIPAFRHFPYLPRPTRSILALRSDMLEYCSTLLAGENRNLRFEKLDALPGSDYFCIDGFHPSSRGYALWAEKLATASLSETTV